MNSWKHNDPHYIAELLRRPRPNANIPFAYMVHHLAAPEARRRIMRKENRNYYLGMGGIIGLLIAVFGALFSPGLLPAWVAAAITCLASCIVGWSARSLEKDYNRNVALPVTNYMLSRAAAPDSVQEKLLDEAVQAILAWQSRNP